MLLLLILITTSDVFHENFVSIIKLELEYEENIPLCPKTQTRYLTSYLFLVFDHKAYGREESENLSPR